MCGNHWENCQQDSRKRTLSFLRKNTSHYRITNAKEEDPQIYQWCLFDFLIFTENEKHVVDFVLSLLFFSHPNWTELTQMKSGALKNQIPANRKLCETLRTPWNRTSTPRPRRHWKATEIKTTPTLTSILSWGFKYHQLRLRSYFINII